MNFSKRFQRRTRWPTRVLFSCGRNSPQKVPPNSLSKFLEFAEQCSDELTEAGLPLSSVAFANAINFVSAPNMMLRAGIFNKAIRDGKPDPNSWNANLHDWTLIQVVSSYLRASSDRSRIKLKRFDPVTKQSHEIIDSTLGLNAPERSN